jgi:L-alanine-DL-glutamate epimerase-like enolase superfamily enzyme
VPALREEPDGRWPEIERVEVAAYTIPTDAPESDGTIEWQSTTMVVVHVAAGRGRGLGWSYASAAAAALIDDQLAPLVRGRSPMAVPECWDAMVRAVRNVGRPGIASTAIAAVDVALWDLKAKLLGLPLVALLGPARAGVPVYGSGGFTSYSEEQLRRQLGGWAEAGIGEVKMKVGRDPAADPHRVRAAREAIGPEVRLFVDANGAYTRAEALAWAERFAGDGATWFEEPVSSDDLEGLRLLRDRAPAGMAIAAGEYGYDLPYFRRMLEAGAVDVLQADATRCGGITGFLRVAPLCEARSIRLSAHTAPSVHLHPCSALSVVRNIEYFHDHARIEHLLLDGARTPERGELRPDLSRPGLGVEFKEADAAPYQVYGTGRDRE